jgi:hypothetical protein
MDSPKYHERARAGVKCSGLTRKNRWFCCGRLLGPIEASPRPRVVPLIVGITPEENDRARGAVEVHAAA